MKKAIGYFFVFGCGGIFMVNLERLTSYGHAYQASWFNVFLSVMFALYYAIFNQD